MHLYGELIIHAYRHLEPRPQRAYLAGSLMSLSVRQPIRRMQLTRKLHDCAACRF